MEPGEVPLFLHAAHQVRQAFDGLQLVSWLAIGIGAGVLVLTWGRLLAWIREPELRPPSVKRWGQDGLGWYFELERSGVESWFVESASDGRVSLAAAAGEEHLLRPIEPLKGEPTSVVSAGSVRLSL